MNKILKSDLYCSNPLYFDELPTLWPSDSSVAFGAPSGSAESCARLTRGQSASRPPPSRSKKHTAPYSNSVPMMPSVAHPSPSR